MSVLGGLGEETGVGVYVRRCLGRIDGDGAAASDGRSGRVYREGGGGALRHEGGVWYGGAWCVGDIQTYTWVGETRCLPCVK